MPTLKYPLILGSASEVRATILNSINLPFEVSPSPYDEDAAKADIAPLNPAEKAAFLAEGKAQALAGDYANHLILTADQVCECNGTIFSKPKNETNAKEQLSILAGRAHNQHSAVCLMLNGEVVWKYVARAELHMRRLSKIEIALYVKMDEPFSSCGSYMLEKHGKHLFESINGNDDVIKGLPSIELLNALYALGYLEL